MQGCDQIMKDHYLVVQNSSSWINMVPTKTLLIECLETVVRFFLIFTPAFLILYGQGEIKDILIGMLMLAFQLGIVILKHKAKNGFRFLIYNSLLIFAIILVFPSVWEKLIYTIIQLATVIYYGKRLKAKPTYYMTFSSLIFTIIPYMLYYALTNTNITSMPEAVAIVTIAAIINVISILVYLQIVNRNAVLACGDNDSAKIKEGMNKTSSSVIFLVIFAIFLLNGILWLSGTYDAADRLLKNIKLNSISYRPNNSPRPKVNNKTGADELNAGNKMKELLEAEQKESKILIYIGNIIKFGIIIIVTVVLIYVLYALVIEGKEAFKRLLGYKNSKEKRESVLKDSDAINIIPNTINKVKKVVKESLDTSNNMKIRRLYKKLVKNYSKLGVIPKKYHTAKIISKNIEEVSSKDYTLLTHIYHKARYGPMQCSEDEVKRAKENM